MSEVGLYEKISAVMKDVDYLSKDDHVKFGQTNYKAISEEKVTSTVRQSLLNHGLVIIPIEQEINKVGNISSVNTKYKIIDIETGQYEILASSGEGADTQDKGVGKAMTYAYKYMMLRTFAIPTGEDPDKISSAELDDRQKKEEEKKIVAREKALSSVLIKWQALSGEEPDVARVSLAEFLNKQNFNIDTISAAQLKKYETAFAKRLIERNKEENQHAQ